jgi:hypothetical protein
MESVTSNSEFWTNSNQNQSKVGELKADDFIQEAIIKDFAGEQEDLRKQFASRLVK